ncbi:MAG: MBL fold metallo-hydrolase [Candidatus Cloacimonadota bacterium]|nr:MAG: MBL fold metallo-hydrolase [Candidatus Cloacimonadota bacterium]
MIVRVWGTRGSTPVSSQNYMKYGGSSSCYEIISDAGTRVIVDAGTGIRPLGASLLKELPVEVHLIFSHYHWDHILGFPFFVPCFIPGNKIHIYGQKKGNLSAMNILDKHLMSPPNFPVPLSIMGASLTFTDLEDRGKVELGKNFSMSYLPMNHPNGVIGMRFEDGDKSFVLMTDIEHISDTIPDPALVEFVKNSNLVAYDCQYTPDEYPMRVSFGHSTWRAAGNLMIQGGAKNLLMIHHDPDHDDEFIDQMVIDANEEFKDDEINFTAAFEGQEIKL